MNVLSLPGLRADPVQSYLAALGVARCVAEQADPAAALAYQPSGFALHTELDLEEVVAFFTDRWEPTPVVAPWNKGSGLRRDGSAASATDALNRLRSGSDPRLEPLREAVSAATDVVDSFPDAKISEKQKPELLRRCRARLPDRALDWFDASVVLVGDDPVYPRLLGTGGNLGRMDLSANLYERLDDVIGLAELADRSRSVGWLKDLLLGMDSTPRSRKTPGQYEPGAVGGVNSVSDERDAASVNPWGFVLALEGALLFASLPARRLGSSTGFAAMPFTVSCDAAGSAGLAADETRFAELWLPLWDHPATFAQLRRLFGEGRLAWGRTTATSAIDAARAIASFGAERGIAAFQRFAVVERLGQSPLIVPAERYPTVKSRRPALESTRALDGWVGRLRSEQHQPAGVAAVLRRYDSALLRLAAGERGAILPTLTSLAELDAGVRRNQSLRGELRPLPWLDPATWLPELINDLDQRVEFELAVAAASAFDVAVPDGLQHRSGTWPRTVSVALRGLDNASIDARRAPTWSDRTDAAAPPGRMVAWLADVHVRHAAGVAGHDPASDHGRAAVAGPRGVATTFTSGRWASPAALRMLVSGQVDESLFDRLLRCLALFDPRGDWSAPAPTATVQEPPVDQGWLALRWLLAHQGRDTFTIPDPMDGRSQQLRLRPSPDWPALLRQGRVDRVLADAQRRFRAAGLPVVEPPDPPTGSAIGDRLAAALLLPISGAACVALLRQLLDPTRISVRDVQRHIPDARCNIDQGGIHAPA